MAILTGALLAASVSVGGAIYLLFSFYNFIWHIRRRDRVLEQFPNKPRHWLFGNIKQVGHKAFYPKPSERGVYAFGKPWLGEGLVLSNDRKWERHRKLLTKAFHFDILRGYIEAMNEASDIMLAKLETHAAKGTDFPLYTTMSQCTLDVMLRCAFSYQNDVQDRGEDHPYMKAVNELSQLWLNRGTTLIGYLPIWHLTCSGRTFRKHCQYVHGISEEVIRKRRENMNAGDTLKTSSRKYLDFLDMLLVARDEDGNGLTDTDIRDEVSTFMFAGQDTTASALSWTLYELSLHPQYQARCQKEIDEILRGRDLDDITWDDLSKLSYLSMCIKEAVRLHGVVPFIMRELSKDLVIDGKMIPKGHTVSVSIYSLHHNPLVWENSMEYQPDRFCQENIEKRDPYSFIPFSAGARNCIGQHFSMHEQKIVLSKILKRFHVSADPEMELVTTMGITTHPNVNMKLKVTTRI